MINLNISHKNAITLLKSESVNSILLLFKIFRRYSSFIKALVIWMHTFNEINNNSECFTPQILAERMKKELLKGLPREKTLLDSIESLIEM